MPDDLWRAYLLGTQAMINRLKERRGDTDPLIDDVRMLAHRMQHGITSIRRYGETPAHLAELHQIYYHLDQIAREALQVSFNEVSGMSDEQIPPQPPERSVKIDSKIHIKGDVHGPVGDFAAPVYVTYGAEVKDGVKIAERGLAALRQKDFATARQMLEEAVQLIDQQKNRIEAAQAHFYLALACLGGKLPSQIKLDIVQVATTHLDVAKQIRETRSYIEMLVAIKGNLGRQLRSEKQESQELLKKTQQLPLSALDLENRQLVSQTQPDLWADYFPH